MKEIKKIDKRSLAKIYALIYGLIGFIIALIVAVSAILNIVLHKDFQGSIFLVTLYNTGAGLVLAVFTALLTALLGWCLGYISALLYNWFAKNVGGVKVELMDASKKNNETAIKRF